MLAATSFSSASSTSSARSRWSRTIVSAPPSARSVESCNAVRTCGAFLVPEPLEDELQVRRLDASAALPDAGNLVEHRFDERGLHLHRLPGELVPARYRTDDRRARGSSIEMLEPQLVREDRRQSRLERVELGERILAERDQHVHARVLVHQLRQLVKQASLRRLLSPW